MAHANVPGGKAAPEVLGTTVLVTVVLGTEVVDGTPGAAKGRAWRCEELGHLMEHLSNMIRSLPLPEVVGAPAVALGTAVLTTAAGVLKGVAEVAGEEVVTVADTFW